VTVNDLEKHMSGLTTLLMFSLQLAASDQDVRFLRAREDALANALRAQDNTALGAMLNTDFHAFWRDGTAWKNSSVEVGRADWIENMMRLQIASYQSTVTAVNLARNDQAFVDLYEFWIIVSAQGGRIAKRFQTRDAWFKVRGRWTLIERSSQTNPLL
jgi:hypothetical protein